MKKPNFFLLGAGRSGSTYLFNLLKQHPDIFLSSPKEPSFFCESFQVIKNPVDYFELFESAGDAKIRGEASHVYLSNPKTPRLINLLFPNARFLIILRNPADRAHSLYQWMRRFGHEPLETFEQALDAEGERYQSDAFKQNAPHYFYNSMYFRSGLYGQQIKRYYDIFPEEQFLILKFDEFISRPRHHLKAIFKFLEVDKTFTVGLNVKKNQGAKSLFKPEIRDALMREFKSDQLLLERLTGVRFK